MSDRPGSADRPEDLDLLRAAIADETRDSTGEHPDSDRLVDYFRGRLDPQAEDAVQEHITLCASCADTALDLADLTAATENASERDHSEPADLASAAAWRRLNQKLSEDESAPPPLAAPRNPQPRWLIAVAATLALATVGLAVWNYGLRLRAEEREHLIARLYRPQQDLATVYLEPGGSERGAGVWLEELAAEDSYLLLVLTPENFDGKEYELTIRSAAEPSDLAAEAKKPTTVGALTLSDHGTVRVLLPRSLIQPGNYRLSLEAFHAARSWPAGDYQLRIR